MHIKIEPSGCCELKGLVQIRTCFYLEPGEVGYDEFVYQSPIIPEGGYTGGVDDAGNPTDIEDYNEWLAGLDTEQKVNPFHNHFIYVPHTSSDEEILDKAEAFAREAYVLHSNNQLMDMKNKDVVFPDVIDKESCDARVDELIATNPSRTKETSSWL
jgi:hypothetical protein